MMFATTTILSLTILPLATTHTLASVGLIIEEVRVVRVVRIDHTVASRVALDELLRVTTNLRGGASSAHYTVEHFAVLVAENHRIAAVTAGTTGLVLGLVGGVPHIFSGFHILLPYICARLDVVAITTALLTHTSAATTSLVSLVSLVSLSSGATTTYHRRRTQGTSRVAVRITMRPRLKRRTGTGSYDLTAITIVGAATTLLTATVMSLVTTSTLCMFLDHPLPLCR